MLKKRMAITLFALNTRLFATEWAQEVPVETTRYLLPLLAGSSLNSRQIKQTSRDRVHG